MAHLLFSFVFHILIAAQVQHQCVSTGDRMETSWAELEKWEIQDQSGCLELHKRARTVCLVDYSDIIKKARSGSLLLLSVWLKWQITWMSWVTQYHWAASGALLVSKQQGGGLNYYYGLYYSMGAIVTQLLFSLHAWQCLCLCGCLFACILLQ